MEVPFTSSSQKTIKVYCKAIRSSKTKVPKLFFNSRSYNPLVVPISETIFTAFIVVFSDPEDQDFYRTFHYFWKTLFITDVIVVSNTRQEPCVDVYSYQPFTSTKCRVVTVEKIDQICENSSNTPLEIFPRTIKDLHKCEIRGSASTGPNLKSPFYEESTLKQFSRILNFTFHITIKDIKYSEVFDLTKFDLAYGSNILTQERIKIMSASYPHSTKGLYMFLKYEKNCKTSLEILLEPFHWTMWLALIISSIFGATLLSISKNSSIMNESSAMFRMLLGISTRLSANHFAVKIQYFCWMCLGLMISATHHAIFFDILKFDLHKPLPRTLRDVVDTKFVQAIIVPEPIGEQISGYLRRFTDMEIITERVNGIIPTVLHGKQRLLGVITSTMVAFSGEDIESFYILEDNLSTIFSAIYFTKNSFLLKTFNKLALELHRSGILQKWRDDFFGQVFAKCNDASRVKALSMGELYGIFNICTILLLMACGSFVAEVIYFRIRNKYF